MSLNVFWFIPTQGDGRYLGTDYGARPATFEYFSQVARAADNLGYHGVLLPTGRGCDDPWVTASGLAAVTTRLKFLVAVRPGLMSPTLAYRMAATLDRQSRGRLLINVVVGGDVDELHGDGVFLDHDQRYQQTDEFLTIWRGLEAGKKVDFDGELLRVQGGQQLFPAFQDSIPLYFGGSSPAGMDVAAKQLDMYLTWGEPPEQVAEKVAKMKQRAAEYGRTIRFGIRLHVIVRDTVAEARRDAEKLTAKVTSEVRAAAQSALAKYESEGQRRMLELQKNNANGLWLRPDLWAGVGSVRGGAGTAMVGDGETVAALMQEYADVGIDTFILSGYPHLEEAYQFAEHVFPRLDLQQTSDPKQKRREARSEVIANGSARVPAGANGQS